MGARAAIWHNTGGRVRADDRRSDEVSGGIWNSLRNASDDQRSQFVRLFIILLGTWAFLALAHEVRTEGTQELDERMMLSVRRADDPGVPIGPAWVQDTARDITALGGYSVLILL